MAAVLRRSASLGGDRMNGGGFFYRRHCLSGWGCAMLYTVRKDATAEEAGAAEVLWSAEPAG